jgi:hypothetical protein
VFFSPTLTRCFFASATALGGVFFGGAGKP